MRVVVSNSDVAHLWANMAQDEARNSNNSFYFYNDTIYSYGGHFPIAKHVTNENGQTAVLFTTRGYSNTTSKQIGLTRMACNHLKLIYCFNPSAHYSVNFSEELKEAENVVRCLTNARKPEKYLADLDRIKNRVQIYADFIGVAIPLDLQSVLNIANKEEYFSYAANKKAIAEKMESDRIKAEKKKHKADLKKWSNFEISRLYNRPDNLDYLRVNGDTVETSQAIKMTIEEAAKLQNALKNGLISVGMTILSHYTVKSIDKNFVQIGCHRFKRAYLETFVLS